MNKQLKNKSFDVLSVSRAGEYISPHTHVENKGGYSYDITDTTNNNNNINNIYIGCVTKSEVSSPNRVFFVVPGILKGKGRPRFVRSTGRAYTPQSTLSCEQWVKHCALQAGIKPLEGALAVEVVMAVPVPPSWPKKRREEALAGITRPTGRPDVDNCLKLIGDSLNGVAWRGCLRACSGIRRLALPRHTHRRWPPR